MDTQARAKSPSQRKKPREEWSKITQKEISIIFCAITNFFAQDYFALHYLEKQTFLQLAQASFKEQYFGIFQNFKVFLQKFLQSKLRFNMRHEICVNRFIYRLIIHDAIVLLNLFLLLSACFFIFTLILIEANLKFQQMFKLKFIKEV